MGVAAVEPTLSSAVGKSALISRRPTGASVKDSNAWNGFSAPATDAAELEWLVETTVICNNLHWTLGNGTSFRPAVVGGRCRHLVVVGRRPDA